MKDHSETRLHHPTRDAQRQTQEGARSTVGAMAAGNRASSKAKDLQQKLSVLKWRADRGTKNEPPQKENRV